ncbi:hypothetical protein BDV19DRAFT_378057 [Aspergillus venezuelensis]
MEEPGTQPEPQLEAQPEKIFVSPAGSPLAVGEPGDTVLSPDIRNITCCIVQIFALIYSRVPRVSNYERSIALFNSRPNILTPCGPLPLSSPNEMNHKYPRFKVPGRIIFWQLVPGNYMHFECKPENIEWNLGMYFSFNFTHERAIDVKDDVELVDLIDGQNLTPEWGEENLDLEGTTDTEWLEEYYQSLCAEWRAEGKPAEFVFLDPAPMPRRKTWDFLVKNENKRRRLGWKYPAERYATRYRKHGSVDPRTRVRPGL